MTKLSPIEKRIETLNKVDRWVIDPPFPKNMMVELSNACNHACIFCTNPHMKRKRGRISTPLLEKVMEEAVSEGVEEIGFYTTGDPFVHVDLENFTGLASKLGFKYIYISTNGALADQERFKRVIDAGMTSIKFSINAGSRETYKFIHGKDDWNKVMENLKFVSAYRKTIPNPPSLFVTYVITQQTRNECDSFKEKILPLVDDIYFVTCDDQQGQMMEAELLYGFPQERKPGETICSLPFNRLHITYEGYLTLCCVDYQNYLAVSDLNTMSLKDAWYSEEYKKARKMHLDKKIEGTLCGNCWLHRKDPIEPLHHELASKVDFKELYQEEFKKIKDRIEKNS